MTPVKSTSYGATWREMSKNLNVQVIKNLLACHDGQIQIEIKI